MAIFTVTNTNDSGAGSLRDAIDQATNTSEGADIIEFDASLAGQTIRLASRLRVTDDISDTTEPLTIDGDIDNDGKADITISGDANGDDTTIAGTGITNLVGTAATELDDNVQILSSASDLTLDGLVLTGGVTTNNGGAVSGTHVAGTNVTLINSIVSGNSANSGGGIFASGIAILFNTTVSDNTAVTLGGGILADAAGLMDTTISGNRAGNRGGGIDVNDILNVKNSTLSDNTAGTDGGGAFASFLILTDSTVSGNSAGGTGGGLAGSGVTLTNVTISGNSADGNGGGVSTSLATLTNTTISGNSAGGTGGGVLAAVQADLTNSIVLGNDATTTDELHVVNPSTRHLFGGNIIGTDVFSGETDVGNTTLHSVFAAVGYDPHTAVVSGLLADNGGPVETIALKESGANPALDASNIDAPANDARGETRFDNASIPNPNGSAADLGAYELQASPDATWVFNPTVTGPVANTFDFNAAANWDPDDAAPEGTAFFGATNGANISFSEADTSIGGWTFNADAADHTFTVGGTNTPGEQYLRFNGAGITINGGSVTINLNSNVGGTIGRLEFQGDSTAGGATINVNGAPAIVRFLNTSSAGNAVINNLSILSFQENSGAGSAIITNNGQFFSFSGNSSAENADITTNDSMSFNGTSSAGQAKITNNASLLFHDNSAAENATITTSGGGTTAFVSNGSGGNARFITQAGGQFDLTSLSLSSTGTTAGSIEGAGSYLLGGKSLTVGSNGLHTEVSGVISGDGGSLVKTGIGTLTLEGTNTYTGATQVNSGTLLVNGSIADSVLTAIAEEAFLGGNGTVGAVQVVGGTLAPGSSAGILTTGDLEFLAAATSELAIDLGGTGAGTGYDQVAVDGAVTLGGATLDVSLLGGFVPTIGTSFTIIANDGSDAVFGTFADLAQAATFNVGTSFFSISYSGGDGNDVVLTAVEQPPPEVGVTINGTPEADIVDATQTVAGQPLPTAFDDVVNSFGGNDSLNTLAGNDQIFGGKGDDQLFGEDGNDVLLGDKGKDQLFGGLGADFLSGGFGRNKLTGGTDADQFVFDSKIGKGKEGTNNKSSFSKVTDFTEGDLIELSQAVFKKIALGVLSDDAFRDVGEKATNDTRITYKVSGELSYDKDGKGGADAVVFAKLTTKPDIDASDFLVVA